MFYPPILCFLADDLRDNLVEPYFKAKCFSCPSRIHFLCNIDQRRNRSFDYYQVNMDFEEQTAVVYTSEESELWAPWAIFGVFLGEERFFGGMRYFSGACPPMSYQPCGVKMRKVRIDGGYSWISLAMSSFYLGTDTRLCSKFTKWSFPIIPAQGVNVVYV